MDAKKVIDELTLLSFMLKSKGDPVYKAVDAGIAAVRKINEIETSWELFSETWQRPTQAELEDIFQGVEPEKKGKQTYTEQWAKEFAIVNIQISDANGDDRHPDAIMADLVNTIDHVKMLPSSELNKNTLMHLDQLCGVIKRTREMKV